MDSPSREAVEYIQSGDAPRHGGNLTGAVDSYLKAMRLETYECKNVGTYPDLDSKWRRRLAEFYRPHNQRLEECLNTEFR